MLLDTAEARERLAAAIHELWVHWMTHFQKQVCWQEGVGWIVPEELIVRWQRQMEGFVEDVSGFGGHTSVWVRNVRTSKRYRLDIRRVHFCSTQPLASHGRR
jgi:hypothetical protein